ncbi:D-tyrosyl-tRNA(Tyr) deacylase [Agyrium rufum]|nr:D-tyrosyl-tRNA(Tyr) deacylase [Agyrium rufum]
MAAKVLKEKIWPDELGTNWKRSVVDIDGELLCVSQFTLMANTRKGAKPDFHSAANPEKGRELYDLFLAKVRALYVADRVKNGIFQAMMDVELVNDGPVGVDYRYEDGVVTLQIETNPPRSAKAENEAEEPSRSTFEMPASLLE